MDTVRQAILNTKGLQALLENLIGRGYRVLGPTIQDRAIVYDEVASVADFPLGWTDEQEGGHYRLARREDKALFGYAVGPSSWKRFLHPPVLDLWRAEKEGDSWRVAPDAAPGERVAFVGVRACELEAIRVQDRVLLGGEFIDPHYRTRRESIFVVAVNCSVAGGTCFCVSMNAGPKADFGYDLAMTEITSEENGSLLVVEAGTEVGHEVLSALPHRAATQMEIETAESVINRTAASMGRQMRSDDLRELLLQNLDHPRWVEVAGRCLTCGNCTMVCPTCFCTTVEDASDLSGTQATRTRRWDSCFTMDFSYLHGGSVRASARSRYRQWMTHKLATWIDQFGTSGCVGCGRCITWCPVGIDITEEVRAIRESEPH